jgi:hypothetical protein
MGKTFSTGNSTVATLPVGTILEVSGKGQLTVVEAPAPEPGDRILSKYGPATVVRITNRDGLDETFANAAGDVVVYIADGTTVVRVADPSNVEAI